MKFNLNGNNNKTKSTNSKKPPSFIGFFVYIFLTLILVAFVFSGIENRTSKVKTENISLSQLARDISTDNILKIDVIGEEIKATYKDETIKKTKKETDGSLTDSLKNYGVTPEKISQTEISFKNESGIWFILGSILQFAGPFILVILFLWFLSRQAKGSGMQAFSFGQSRAKLTNPEDEKQKVTFKDVAGNKEAKIELEEIVDFLKNPKKFLDIGARIPKGVLLTGSPGTGKTLLARAVAGEANVPFYHLSGSEFVELFVGIGASRVRDLFAVAKKSAPSIIFIDEIDAVGRVRGGGVGGGNDEREQTLNQILVEMDGFEPNEKVIIMAATNRSDVLDPALLRPGRFDRRVILDLPDRKDREEILTIHLNNKPKTEDVNTKIVAERTSGFSGADIYSLVNESAILAAREDRQKVAQFDLIRSIEKVMMGPERKSHLFSTHEKKITAYHEAGHAIIGSVLPDSDPVHKVTIVSRGRAGGYTWALPLEEKKLQTRAEFLDDITMSLGGYVAEEMIFGDITTGPSNDLQVSTALARAMVTRWGMSKVIGPIALESDGGKPLYGMGVEKNQYSESMSAKIDEEVAKIITSSLERARQTLKDHQGALDAVAMKLVEVETLEQEEYNNIIIAHGIIPKKKTDEMGQGIVIEG